MSPTPALVAIATHAAPQRAAPERPAPDHAAWPRAALCKGKTGLFFGPPGERPSKRRRREAVARSYCQVCPLQIPCRERARLGRENGLWGNENDEERAALGCAPRATERRSVATAARTARQKPDIPAATDEPSVAPLHEPLTATG
ncbi:MAG: WhiB family transcriptional regulator [Acidimicrobiales bacterium]